MKANTTENFYYQIDAEILMKYADTQKWVEHNPVFTEPARLEFASVADAFLIATAASKGHTLVTNEKSDPGCRKRVKIPDVCIALGVRYCDLNTAFRELGITI